jgi:hypothetical protein
MKITYGEFSRQKGEATVEEAIRDSLQDWDTKPNKEQLENVIRMLSVVIPILVDKGLIEPAKLQEMLTYDYKVEG